MIHVIHTHPIAACLAVGFCVSFIGFALTWAIVRINHDDYDPEAFQDEDFPR